MKLNGLDLFSGIGGISEALDPWVETRAYCERDPYAQAVLLSRMERGEIDVGPLIRQATQTLLAEQAGRLLGNPAQPDNLDPRRALDSLFDLIRGEEDRKDPPRRDEGRRN